MPLYEALYALPSIPLISRGFLCLRWSWIAVQDLPEAAQDRDTQRSTVLALAGFSFTAAAGLAVLEDAMKLSARTSIWYVLVSFVAYISCVNLQSYKSTIWQNQLSSALIETGSLSLSLTLVSLLIGNDLSDVYKIAVAAIALLPWLADHLIRLRIDHIYFLDVDNARRAGKAK